ncbi:MAG: chaperone NapD [Spirochaetia bacterium]|nr:chaperone NapD [Spirochaetia bacterium]
MIVSILLVQVPVGNEDSMRDNINNLGGVEVTESGNGYLVAATDSETSENDYKLIEEIKRLENIINVSLVMTADESCI